MPYAPDSYPRQIPQFKVHGRGEVTVSAKGIITGDSNIPNDGADFGPDTMLGATGPGQYGPPYTDTLGITEAINYANGLSINDSVQFVKVVSPLSLSSPITIGPYVHLDFCGNSVIIDGTFSNVVSFGANSLGLTFGKLSNVRFELGSSSSVTNAIVQTTTSFSSRAIIENVIIIGNSSNNSAINIGIEFSGSNNLGENLYVSYASVGFQFDNGLTGGFLKSWYYNSTAQGTGIGMNISNASDTIEILDGRLVQANYGIQIECTTTNTNDLYFSGFNIDAVESGVNIITSGSYYVNNLTIDGWSGATEGIASRFIQGGPVNFLIVTGSSLSGMANGVLNLSIKGMCVFTSNNIQNIGSSPATNHAFSLGGGTALIVSNTINLIQDDNTTPYPYLLNGQNSCIVIFKNNQISYTGTAPISVVNLPLGSIFDQNYGVDNPITPTLSTNPPVSGTVYQNTNPFDIEIDLPVYATTSGTAGYVTIAKGSSSTPTAIGNQYVNGATSSTNVDIIKLRVPAGWYYSFTASGVTFGTASVFAD